MGFFASFLGSGLLQTAGVLALDATAALLNGPKPQKQADLKNKSVRSDAYGTPWTRARGVVRCQGKVLWASKIQTSVWKTTSGGFFGLGQQSVYYNKYSVSMFIGFGKKLGGGAANAILRIWADGKLLFNSVLSTGAITGTVTISTVSGGQQPGSLILLADLAGGSTLNLNAGDLIIVPGDMTSYEVQSPVNLTGPLSQAQISIWPPLQVNLPGTGALTLAGLSSSPYDLSSLDPNPHDGSHFNSGYQCPPGGIQFYLGSATQQPDPTMVKWLGAGNVPGYRGLCGVMIHDLQLVNYGDHQPQITAEIAFDVANGAFPLVGPISLPDATASIDSIAIPGAGESSASFLNPLNALPYVFIRAQVGGVGVLYRVNRISNQVEARSTVAGTVFNNAAADADGMVYWVGAAALNNWHVYKFDGLAMSAVIDYGPVTSGPTNHERSVGSPVGGAWLGSTIVWDSAASLFGNPVLFQPMATLGAGTIFFFDRKTLLPFGIYDPTFTNLEPIVSGYDKSGTPIVTTGLTTSYSSSSSDTVSCVDANGNLWTLTRDVLTKWDCQPQSAVDLSSGKPILNPPSFAQTAYSVAALCTNASHPISIFYDPADNSILIMGDTATGKLDITTGTVSVLGGSLGFAGIGGIDIPGSVLGASTGVPNNVVRVDSATGQITNQYVPSNWLTGAVVGYTPYDQLTDSLWYPVTGGLYRMFLDRGNGQGLSIDQIVASLLSEAEAGYSSGQYDVTPLTASGETAVGWEFERETYIQSLNKMRQFHLFDIAPIDGKIVNVPRGQASAMTIPESDLGALDDPSKYEPRVDESVEDALDIPESVWIRHYDPLKNDQQATQYAKRISKPYASSLSTGKDVTSSRQQLDITLPITENATPVKQHADRILWDLWAGRFPRKFKLGYKYIRLDPTDVVTLAYKSGSLETRIEETDIGARLAVEISGRSQDSTIYPTIFIPASSPGVGSSTPPTQPPVSNSNYTLNPVNPLSSPNSTTIDVSAFVASFTSGLRLQYAVRTITVTDPGPGNTALYYVTIVDTSFVGDNSTTTPVLTALCDTDPTVAHVGQLGYINCGSIIVAGAGATGGSGGTGGQPILGSGVLVAEIAFGPTAAADVSGFRVAHGLGAVPSDVQIQIVGVNGNVWFQALRYDSQYVYLVASDAGISGYLEIFN